MIKKKAVKKNVTKEKEQKFELTATPPFTIKIKNNGGVTGTLVVTREGVEFLPRCFKKKTGRILRWDILANLMKVGLT